MPIAALLGRIRQLIPCENDGHYLEILNHFGVGTLRPPPRPISDHDLAHAIGKFLEETPSTESIAALGRRLNPATAL